MITLTPSQQNSFEAFCEFINSQKQIFILKGAAGTGKTTLVKEFINHLDALNRSYTLMAPTGRAALILGNRTISDSSTIHRKIYELFSNPQKVEERWIFSIKENTEPTHHIYFVDEASMLSNIFSDNEMTCFGSGHLLTDLIEYCNVQHTHRKIVFIGDYAQLPPVQQNFSPALSADYIRTTFNLCVQECKLTEIVRQKTDSGILAIVEAIRAAIDTQTFNRFQIKDDSDVQALDNFAIESLYQDIINQGQMPQTAIVTHSNGQAQRINQRIRTLLWGDKSSEIQPNDLIINTRNNYSKIGVELFNGMIFRVLEVSPNVEIHQPYVGNKKETLRFREIVIETSYQAIKLFILEDFLTTNNGSLPFDTYKALWADLEQRMRKREIYPSDKAFAEAIRNDPYYNALQCKYAYAITCHKAQGGEWKNVFVNLDTFLGKHNEMFFRWAYTALTRAKAKLWHISSPSFSAIDHICFQEIKQCSPTKISFYTPSGQDWKEHRFGNICSIANLIGIDCKEILNINYQHRIVFQQQNDLCELSLWYNKTYYNGTVQVLKSSSESFTEKCKNICQESLYLTPCKFKPRFPFQQELHNHIADIANETNIRITNIDQKQWCDTYYLKTEAEAAYIEFFFNGKQIYTYAQPYSSRGKEDKLLQQFLTLFNECK